MYSSDDLDHSAGGVDPEVVLQDRLTKAKERLELALEQEALLAEPVHLRWMCCCSASLLRQYRVPDDLQEHEPLRMAYYKAVAELTRAYAALANELSDAGYLLRLPIELHASGTKLGSGGR